MLTQNAYRYMPMDELAKVFSAPFLNQNQHEHVDVNASLSSEGNPNHIYSCSSTRLGMEGALGEEDFSDATLRLINQMLMEEDDLENKPCMFQECSALQATEKSFYDALAEDYTPPSNQIPLAFHFDHSIISSLNHDYLESLDSSGSADSFFDMSSWLLDREKHDQDSYSECTFEDSILPPTVPSHGSCEGSVESYFVPLKVLESSNESVVEEDENKQGKLPNRLREKKSRDRDREEGIDFVDGGRGNKQFSSSTDQDSDDQFHLYDKVLLCPPLNPNSKQDSSLFLVHDPYAFPNEADMKLHANHNDPSKGSNIGKGNIEKEDKENAEVDLMTLLSQCAQAVSRFDHQNAYCLLNQIRQHSSPHGDDTERLAHYFANAFEARLAGTGAALYAAFTTKRVSTADILRAYEVHVKACPFNWLSNGYANQSIRTLVNDSQRLHIIDFGILYGFQWPCLIQNLSMRPGGPPKVRITGIDLPQPGFRPAERVEETGRRLATYCERFGVPFQFHAVAKKWDEINLNDLKLESNEVRVVNCLYRLRNIPDETAEDNCPRDKVLSLMRRINPDMFVHGIVNAACCAPFMSRFRATVLCASSLFDMFEATLTREDEGRSLYEKEVWGRDIMNVIACEDGERVERLETYKQWQVRNVRAGFRQLPLNREILRELKGIVKLHYNKNFTVEEDGKWMLQGWKGRIMFALSCWKPVIKES